MPFVLSLAFTEMPLRTKTGFFSTAGMYRRSDTGTERGYRSFPIKLTDTFSIVRDAADGILHDRGNLHQVFDHGTVQRGAMTSNKADTMSFLRGMFHLLELSTMAPSVVDKSGVTQPSMLAADTGLLELQSVKIVTLNVGTVAPRYARAMDYVSWCICTEPTMDRKRDIATRSFSPEGIYGGPTLQTPSDPDDPNPRPAKRARTDSQEPRATARANIITAVVRDGVREIGRMSFIRLVGFEDFGKPDVFVPAWYMITYQPFDPVDTDSFKHEPLVLYFGAGTFVPNMRSGSAPNDRSCASFRTGERNLDRFRGVLDATGTSRNMVCSAVVYHEDSANGRAGPFSYTPHKHLTGYVHFGRATVGNHPTDGSPVCHDFLDSAAARNRRDKITWWRGVTSGGVTSRFQSLGTNILRKAKLV